MNYEQAVKKPFTDLGKLVIGIILSIIPIVSWIARGFMLECSGMGKNKPSKAMPEWKDIWSYFIKGLVSYVIAIVYAIPAIVIFLTVAGYAVGSLITITGLMPEGIVSMMPGQVGGALSSQNWMQMMPVLLALAPLLLIGLVLLLVASYVSPIGVLNYLKTKNFGKAFDLNVIKSNALKGNYFLAWIVSGVIFVVIRAVLFFIPVIGSAIAFFVAGVISWDLFGQAFREK